MKLTPVSLLLLLLLLTTDALAQQDRESIRPGAEGDCQGAGNLRMLTANVASNRARTRTLQNTNVIGGAINYTWVFKEEDIPTCCTGNGDYEFLKGYLQIRGAAEEDTAEGFNAIPGASLVECRRACREDSTTYTNLENCYMACDCRQNCPTSNDCLTADCKAQECNFEPGSMEQDICIDECDRQCGERCRSTLNGYVVPIEIYGEALKILDCFYGDLIGDREGSCLAAQAYWQANGHTCDVTADGLDCQCNDAGKCYNEVYPCDYESYCNSRSPTESPSAAPSAPRSSKGKGKGGRGTRREPNRGRVRG